ncbi:hypothetical protein [Streptomyces sp. NBC_00385]|uniref:hypothetical protein n=1 Tax=Streptomyces sp. NBC_00385 TaxID=2975733 RepID=UPI002DD843F2|nr:hypothetical protein [Streptomyces sp. NBC_00385]WRZ01853.1 hypothetical protein OG959_00170 [Streptomyces sp. NBC_00385]
MSPTAPREGYATMAARVQALYDQGRSAREALAECYGVELPDEIFAIADSGIDPKLPDYYPANQPWRLITRPGRDSVPFAPPTPERYEKAVADLDPDLLPLVCLDEEETKHGDSMLCYRLSDLAQGATTVYGIEGAVWTVLEELPAEVPRYGDSLLDVLAEYYADFYAQVEERYYGPGHAVADEMLDEARDIVEAIDRLKRDLTSGLGGQS